MTIKAILARLDALEMARQPPPPPFEFDYEKSAKRQRRYKRVFSLLYQNEGFDGFSRRHAECLAKGKHLASRLLGKDEDGNRHTVFSDHARFLKLELESEKVAESLKGRGERLWAEILAEREARGAFQKTTP